MTEPVPVNPGLLQEVTWSLEKISGGPSALQIDPLILFSYSPLLGLVTNTNFGPYPIIDHLQNP